MPGPRIAFATVPSDKRARQRALREIRRAEEQRRSRRRKSLRRGGIVALVVIVVGGIVFALTSSSGPKPKPVAAKPTTTTTGATTTTTTGATTTTAPKVAPTCPPVAGAARRVTAFNAAPPMCIKASAVFDATVKTTAGTFVIRLDAAASPAAVNNFVFLARYHFYDGIIFHRVIPGFVVQGGDPTGTGAGGPGYSFTGNLPPASCTAHKDCYPAWTVALANTGSPSSDGSQFFIVLPGGSSQLQRLYTVIGTVVSGRTVVAKIGAAGTAGGTPKTVYKMVRVTVRQLSA